MHSQLRNRYFEQRQNLRSAASYMRLCWREYEYRPPKTVDCTRASLSLNISAVMATHSYPSQRQVEIAFNERHWQFIFILTFILLKGRGRREHCVRFGLLQQLISVSRPLFSFYHERQ
ncbi:hypothetical protein SCHPADRAFT_718245 [Schizopora paradoxa]|uniref:Uncharacterized protein n=1 Tax=Schizopora paradoxa TaxID=27342 RepID=A0A0H2R1L5_9AGAM|nr:hypothetical protein SCHPADRAFT_718245 [Schizopora paradoxa]